MRINPSTCDRNRSGFSLLELLLVIAIMGVLTTMSLAVMRSANEDAKFAATQSRISKIESMLRLQLEQYEVRRLPISRGALASFATGTNQLVKMRNLRHRILADIINTEMPRPYLTNPNYDPRTEQPIYSQNSCCNGTTQLNLGDYPLDSTFPAALTTALASQKPASLYRWTKIVAKNGSFDLPAEYLYEILRGIDIDGVSGLESLGNNAFGDTDGDGFAEVIDVWGNPLNFKIQQIEATSTASAEVFTDLETFVDLDTTIPRSIEKFRFIVISPKIEALAN